MRKHLSVLGLAARGAVGRILLITVLTAALAGALLYLVPAQPPSQSTVYPLSLIHISEPTRLGMVTNDVFCLKKKSG